MALSKTRLRDAIKNRINTDLFSGGATTEVLEKLEDFAAVLADEIVDEITNYAEVATTVAVTSVSDVTSGSETSGPGSGSGTGTIS